MEDVTLPNGYVVRGVPDGTSDDVLRSEAIKNGWAAESDFPSQEMSFGENVLAGAAERGQKLVGKGIEFVGESTADLARLAADKAGYTGETFGVDFGEGINSYQDFMQDIADDTQNQKYGYKERYTWEKVKKDKKLSTTLLYSAEQMGKSVPDMLGIMTMPMIYAMARIEEMGDQRAVNAAQSRLESGASQAEIEKALEADADHLEKLKAAPFVAGSIMLERVGLSRLFKPSKLTKKDTLGATAVGLGGAIAKEGAYQAGIEGLQEGVIEYTGETLGTGKEMDGGEMLDRGAAGAFAGGPFGMGVRTATGSVQIAANPNPKNEIERVTKESYETQQGYKDDLAEAQEAQPELTPAPTPKMDKDGNAVVEEVIEEEHEGEAISVKEAAELAGVSRTSIDRRVKKGTLKKINKKLSVADVRKEFGLDAEQETEQVIQADEKGTISFQEAVDLAAKSDIDINDVDNTGTLRDEFTDNVMTPDKDAGVGRVSLEKATAWIESKIPESKTTPQEETSVEAFMELELDKLVELHYTGEAKNGKEYLEANERGEVDGAQFKYIMDAARTAAEEKMASAPKEEKGAVDLVDDILGEEAVYDLNEADVLESRVVDEGIDAIEETKGTLDSDHSIDQVKKNNGFVGPMPLKDTPVEPTVNQSFDGQKNRAVQVNAYGQVKTQAELEEEARVASDVNTIISETDITKTNIAEDQEQDSDLEEDSKTLDRRGGASKFGPMPNYQGTFDQDKMSPEPKPRMKLAGLRFTRKHTKENAVTYAKILRKIRRIAGKRVYHGNISGKHVGGTYNRIFGAIRIKNQNDVDTLVHEFAHWLDFHSSIAENFQKLYRGNSEVKNLSYTSNPKVVNPEGFAEYARLWLTQYPKVQEHAPNFTKEFEALLKKNPDLWKDMLDLQELSHSYFNQGGDLLLGSLIGERKTTKESVDDFFEDTTPELVRQKYQDSAHGAKVLVRRLLGDESYDLLPSQNPYELLGFALGGPESVYLSIRDDQTVDFDEDGNLVPSGKGLKDVLAPVQRHFGKIKTPEITVFGKTIKKKSEVILDIPAVMKKNREVWEDFLKYLVARRASELTKQNREHLIKGGPIAAGLAKAAKWQKEGIDFEAVALDYQAFNSRMLDFYVSSGLISADQKANFEEMNKDYIPFHRILEGLNSLKNGSPVVGARLTGGTANIKDIEENMTDGLVANIKQALLKRAERAMFNLIDQGGDNGALFANRIPPQKVVTTVDTNAFAKRLSQVLVQLGVGVDPEGNLVANNEADTAIDGDEIVEILEANPHLLDMYSGVIEPRTDSTLVRSVIADGSFNEKEEGKTIYYEVQEPLLIDMLQNLGGKSYGFGWNLAFKAKGLQTRTVTAWPEFITGNVTRDTQHGFFASTRGFIPVYSSIVGMKSWLMKDDHYKKMVRNGMMFSGKIHTNVEESRGRKQLDTPSKNYFDTLGKVVATYDDILSAFEYGSRLGETKLADKEGLPVFSQAQIGRSFSGNFSQAGNSDFSQTWIRTIPFANASQVGLVRTAKMFRDEAKLMRDMKKMSPEERMERLKTLEFYQESFAAKSGLIFVSSMILAVNNREDERYRDLVRHKRVMNQYFSVPEYLDPDRSLPLMKIPKPFELGAMFMEYPNIMVDYIADREGEDMARAVTAVFAHQFGFVTDAPAPIQSVIELGRNKKFTGAPIIPPKFDKLKGSARRMETLDQTAEMYDKIGKQYDVSPLVLEHLSRGWFRYAAKYTEDVTNIMLWDDAAMGNKPSSDWFGERIKHKFVERDVPYATKHTEDFWYYRAKADSLALEQKLIIEEESLLNNKEITKEFLRAKYPAYKKNELTLGKIAPIFAKINTVMGDIALKARVIKYDNKTVDGSVYHEETNPVEFVLSAEEKDQQIEELYVKRNAAFKTAMTKIKSALKQKEDKQER